MQGQIQALCAQHGVQIYATQEPSMPVPPDEFKLAGETELLQLFAGWRARREVQDLKANLGVGMRKRIDRGLHGTSSQIPYGYRFERKGEALGVDPDEAKWVRWIFQRRAERWGAHSIVRELERLRVPTKMGVGHWWPARILAMLRNPYYIGTVRRRDFENPNGLHEPIISDELWNQVQAINNCRTTSSVRIMRPLTGLAECGLCGHAMVYHRTGGYSGRYLRCWYSARPAHSQECTGNHHPAAPIEDWVKARFKEMVGDPDLYFDEHEASPPATNLQAELDAIETQLARETREKERWDAAYASGVIEVEELLKRREAYRSATEHLVRRRNEIKARLSARQATRDSIVTLQEIVDEIDTLSGEELNELYRQIIDRVIIPKQGTPQLILL